MGEDAMLENRWAGRSEETMSHPGSPPAGPDDPPIDLVHLARQCQGDPDLEEELLGLFRLQARALAAQLSDPSTRTAEPTANIAHRLRGSALTVGAARVARAARAIEEGAAQPAALAQAIAALRDAVAEAVAEIERLRA